MKNYIFVPYSEKDIVKNMGAKWDINKKLWYIGDSSNIADFEKWLPKKVDPSNKVQGFYIAQSTRDCYRCKKITPVFAFVYEYEKNHSEVLYYIRHLSISGQTAITKLTSNYYYDFAQHIDNAYWMNHCEHCKAKLGDFETIEEFSGAFYPISIEAAKKITLYEFNEFLEFNSCSQIIMYIYSMEIKGVECEKGSNKAQW